VNYFYNGKNPRYPAGMKWIKSLRRMWFSGINRRMFEDNRPEVLVRCIVDGEPQEVVNAATGKPEQYIKRSFLVVVRAWPETDRKYKVYVSLPEVSGGNKEAAIFRAQRLEKEARIDDKLLKYVLSVIERVADLTLDNIPHPIHDEYLKY